MNFELKCWDTSYIDDVSKYANNKNIADNLRDVFPYPYTRSDAEWYINDCISKEGKNQIARAIVVDNHAVGSIGIFVQSDVYRKSAELGYWLGEDFWNKGIMTEAIKEICKIAFNQFDIVRIYAEPFEHNIGSRRVLEKSGFNLEGFFKDNTIKNGKIFNSCMYALLKNDKETIKENNQDVTMEYLRTLKSIYDCCGLFFAKKSYKALINYIRGMNRGVNICIHKNLFSTFEFSNWYQKTYNFKTTPKENVFSHIENIASNDELAFDLFFEEYIKFLKEVYNIDFLSIGIRYLTKDGIKYFKSHEEYLEYENSNNQSN